MTRTAGIVVLVVAAALSARFALHLVYGWRPAPRRDDERAPCPENWHGCPCGPRVDRDAWPEGVGWTW